MQNGSVPFRMLFISLSSGIQLICAELNKPFVQLSRRPVEPMRYLWSENGESNQTTQFRTAYFGYELSPSPKRAKSTPCKYVGGSRLRSSDFQKARPLAGKSPCPVVEITKITKEKSQSDS
jgi:hypothetical protein